jgi:hypothetical protein
MGSKALFFEKKEAKNLCTLGFGLSGEARSRIQKLFGSRRVGAAFFSKKNCFLPSPDRPTITFRLCACCNAARPWKSPETKLR